MFNCPAATWGGDRRTREPGANGRTSCGGGGGGGWIRAEKIQQRNITCGESVGTGPAETGKAGFDDMVDFTLNYRGYGVLKRLKS